MTTPEEALRLIRTHTPSLTGESVPLARACGRVLSEDLLAGADLPPFDNSAMDGFAVRLHDCSGASPDSPVALKVRETVRAGSLARERLRDGEAFKIMTGAPVPKGTEAVVMREHSEPETEGRVRIKRAPKPGEHIRRAGEDVRAGDPLLSKGTLIRPYEVALLAGQGVKTLPVTARPRIAVVVSGDELVDPAVDPKQGQIRDANGPALMAVLEKLGAAPSFAGIVPDDPERIRTACEKGLAGADALVISGGVSVGDFDHTKTVLEGLGMRTIFWKAAIKPGKPLLFGLCGGKPVFGLPGNPISVLVCTEEFVRPAIEKMSGRVPSHPSYHLHGVLENDYHKTSARQQFLFCRVRETQDGFAVKVIRPQGSAMTGMACKANALALAPIDAKTLAQGATIAFRWLK